MNYDKKTVRDIDVTGKKILLRCDFNVPHDKKTGVIHDDTRIVSTLPTIRYLLEQGAAVILLSHMGRPHGEWQQEMSLFSARDHLERLLGRPVPLTQDVLGPDTKAKCAALQPGELLLVENLRFRIEEEKNDPDFAKELASLADLFVFDAFGAAHRAHASTAGVAEYLPSVAGLLVEKELAFLGKALDDPKRPLVAILGGAKVADKIGVINSLLHKADTIIIGGGMSYTFQVAQGGRIGASLLDEDHIVYAREMIAKAQELGVKLLLPVDNVARPSRGRPPCSGTVPWVSLSSPISPQAPTPWPRPWPSRRRPSPSWGAATPSPPLKRPAMARTSPMSPPAAALPWSSWKGWSCLPSPAWLTVGRLHEQKIPQNHHRGQLENE